MNRILSENGILLCTTHLLMVYFYVSQIYNDSSKICIYTILYITNNDCLFLFTISLRFSNELKPRQNRITNSLKSCQQRVEVKDAMTPSSLDIISYQVISSGKRFRKHEKLLGD